MEGQNDETFDLAEFLQNNPKYSQNLLNKAERFANICKSNATNTSNDTVLYKDTVLEAFRPFLRAYLLDIFKIHLTLQDKIEYYGHRGTIKYS